MPSTPDELYPFEQAMPLSPVAGLCGSGQGVDAERYNRGPAKVDPSLPSSFWPAQWQ